MRGVSLILLVQQQSCAICSSPEPLRESHESEHARLFESNRGRGLKRCYNMTHNQYHASLCYQVKDATSNENWGAPGAVKAEIADATRQSGKYVLPYMDSFSVHP